MSLINATIIVSLMAGIILAIIYCALYLQRVSWDEAEKILGINGRYSNAQMLSLYWGKDGLSKAWTFNVYEQIHFYKGDVLKLKKKLDNKRRIDASINTGPNTT